MNDGTRQRLWLGLAVVLGLAACVQYLNNRDLRSEMARNRVDPDKVRQQVELRAGKLASEAVRERRHDMIATGMWLHAFYQSDDGLKRPEGLWIDNHPDFEGIGAWLFDVYLTERLNGADDATARQTVADAIRHSDEWRQKHPGSR